ncbi:hypothetical protein [Umezawaea tangerina]|uniref:hypothetical protein n=1 Tax=Umezawaea tangerina TaxID=84725 RepID=UPI000D05DD30|nr:hypothetical protein [Umezawaea tangerina]
MTADEEHDDEQLLDEQPLPETAPLPRKSTPRGGRLPVWQTLARDGLPHPCWWHPLNVTTWTGAAGIGIDHLDLSTPTLAIGVGVAGFLGMGVGAAVVDGSSDTTEQYVHPSGYLGGVTGLAMGAWAWIASASDMFNDMWQPAPLLGLVAGGVAFGAAYTQLRYRVASARDPRSRIHYRNKEVKATGTWGEIMARAGFGATTLHHGPEDNWSGYTVWIRLDPERTDTARSVVAAKGKIVGIAARVLGEDGVQIGDDDITITPTENAMIVAIRVRLRRVLTETIQPPEEVQPVDDPTEPLDLGRWEDGKLIDPSESGPHGCAVGASGSGKSTYEHGLTAQLSRRAHVLNLAAGVSKFESFIWPFIQPLVDGRVGRPVYAMIGGGSSGSEADFWSAIRVVAAGHALMTYRMSSPDTPRDGGNLVVSAEHPRVLIQLDEVDALTSFKLPNAQGGLTRPKFRLPSGQLLDVWDMIMDIGSKGRSEGVELEVSTQRLTDKFWGVPVRDFLSNVARRAAFYSASRHDAGEMLKGTKLDALALRNNAMYLAVSSDAPPSQGKACYYTKELIAEFAMRADESDTIGTLNAQEAAALGDLWTGRWNPDRIASILAYFQAADSPTFSAFIDAHRTDGKTSIPTTGPASAPPKPDAGAAKGGRQQLRDAIKKVKRETAATDAAAAGVGRRDQMSDDLAALWDLPAVEESQRNITPPAPAQAQGSLSVVDAVLALFADDETGHVSTADLAERLGRVPDGASDAQRQAIVAALAREISDATGLPSEQRRNVDRYPDRTRGFLLEELRQFGSA